TDRDTSIAIGTVDRPLVRRGRFRIVSTATRAKAEKSARDAQGQHAERATIAPDPDPSTLPPAGPDPHAALNEPPEPAPDPQARRSGDPATIELERQCERLADTIRRHNGDLLGFIAERGDIVADILNAALRKARNDSTRKNLRAAALRQAEL